MLVANCVKRFMSAVDRSEPPISELNAPLKAWKFERSPRQWNGAVACRPLKVCVAIVPFIGWNGESGSTLNGNAPVFVGVGSIAPFGSPRSHDSPSMSPSVWHDAQLIVPLPASFAS